MSIRYFLFKDDHINSYGDTGPDIIEVDEKEWLESDYPIEYERHTVFQKGVNQICLTKIPQF